MKNRYVTFKLLRPSFKLQTSLKNNLFIQSILYYGILEY